MSVTAVGSAALATALGLRHGLDADHLAAIDGLTRFNMVKRRDVAPYCGALFSAGHGAAILFAAALLTVTASAWTPPAWLDPAGKLISATVLLGLGLFNLRLWTMPPCGAVDARLEGFRSGLFRRALRSSNPWAIALVGVLFAVSFDAIGLALLFAANAAAVGVSALALLLAFVFALGMVAVDAGNGAWIARLAGRSDLAGRSASRAMTVAVACISLVVGAAIACTCFYPAFDRWLDMHELVISVMVILSVLLAYLVGRWMRRRAPQG